MSVRRSQEINYQQPSAAHGAYRMSRVLPLGSQSATLSASSTTETLIEIPAKPMNLSKSAIEFTMVCDESATASAVGRLHSYGLTMIERASLYTRNGVYLADLNNCPEFTRTLNPYLTKMADFLEHDSSRGATGVAAALNAKNGDKGFNNFRSNVAVPTATPGVSSAPNGTRIGASGAAEAPSIGSTEPTYFVQGAARDGSESGRMAVNFSVPLNAFHHSIMSQNKDVFLNQAVVLRIHWAPTNKIGFVSTSATDLATGAASLDGAVTISGIRVALAVETNEHIVVPLVEKVRSTGMKILTPYAYSYLFSTPTGTSHNTQLRLNRGHGQRLLTVYQSVFNATSTGRLAFDCNNVASAKVLGHQSQLDNVNLQDSIPIAEEGDDYILVRDLIKGSVCQDNNMYKANRCQIDTWRAGETCDYVERDDVQDGINLDSERIHSCKFTTASGSYRIYTFAICQRELSIQSNGDIRLE